MRTSTVLSVLFAASALAVPVNNKRVLIEDIVVVTVTDFVYPDGSPATPPAVPAPAASPAAAPAPAPAQDSSPHTLFKAPKPTEEPAAPAAPSPAPAPVETHAPAPPSPAPAPVETHAPAPVSAPAPVPTPAPAPSPVAPAPVNGAPHTLVPNLDVTSPTYAAIALAHHNAHRSNHSAPDVGYNQTIADWAQKKAESCVWNEDMPAEASGVGMNIAQGTFLGAGNLSAVISNMWYNGEVNLFPSYGVNNLDTSGESFQGWGHFSQVVWDGTTAIGCGSSICKPGSSIGSGYFVACMYYPPGNFMGDFTKVHQPKGDPTVAVVGNKIVGL